MTEEVTGAAPAAPEATPVVEALSKEPVQAATTETQAAPEPSLEDDLRATWDKLHKPAPERDEQGRFRSNNSEAQEAPAEAVPEADQAPAPEAVEPAKPAIDAPVSWSREMKEKWATLAPEAQQYIAQREREAAQTLTRYGQQIKAIEPVANILEQNRQIFERYQVKPEVAIAKLLEAQAKLDADPISGIAEIARLYDVDLGTLQGATVQPMELVTLRAENNRQQQEIEDLKRRVIEREEREMAARRQSLETQVEDFRKANPDFALVENEVVGLIPLIRSQDIHQILSEKEILAQAYEQAGWLNPTIRANRLKAEAAKQAEEARKKAEEAKKVQSINVRSSTAAGRGKGNTIDDDLNAIAARLYGTR